MIEQWIHGDYGQDTGNIAQIAADPDSTIDFMGSTSPQLTAVAKTSDSEFGLPVLYDDPQTLRIIVLLKKIKNSNEKIVEMSRKAQIVYFFTLFLKIDSIIS